MNPHAPKTPPRYVPTLTEVVSPEALALPAEAGMAAPPAAPFVSVQDARPQLPPAPAPASVPTPAPSQDLVRTEEELVQRLLQRVMPTLDERLGAAIDPVLQEHADALALRLQQTLATLVHESVQAAVRQELVLSARPASR